MKKTVATKWIKALRSGKYKQGRRLLRTTDDKFCCLGVLCDVMKIPCWEYPKINADDQSLVYHFGEKADSKKTYAGLLPPMAINKAGMKSEDGTFCSEEERNTFKKKYGAVTLVGMNDSGKTFEEIANVIEENWDKL